MTHSNSTKAFRLLDFDRYYNNRLTSSATTLSTLHDTTKEGFINFDNTRQRSSLTAYHRYSISLKNSPSRTVTSAQSSFQGFSRKTVLGSCKMPCGFKPSRQWCSRFVQNCASCYRCLVTTCGTNQSATSLSPWLHMTHAFRAMKAIWPSQVLQVVCTCAVIREILHEFAVSVWEIVSCCHAL